MKIASSETFASQAAIAGCSSCALNDPPAVFPPGKTPPGQTLPERALWLAATGRTVSLDNRSANDRMQPIDANGEGIRMPLVPYVDAVADAFYMTDVAGTATIAGGATTEVTIQPTMGTFSGYYIEIYAFDTDNPQSRQNVLVGRFSVGDCPGDCRTIALPSVNWEANQACCNGRPFRSTFGRTNDGTELRVDITNPNTNGSVDVFVKVKGYCHRGSCAC